MFKSLYRYDIVQFENELYGIRKKFWIFEKFLDFTFQEKYPDRPMFWSKESVIEIGFKEFSRSKEEVLCIFTKLIENFNYQHNLNYKVIPTHITVTLW